MIVPSKLGESRTYRSAVTLAHYAKAVQYSECAVYGVNNPADRAGLPDACRDVWTLDQRNYALRYLSEAQIELENETKRLFNTTWVVGDIEYPDERLTDITTFRRINPNKFIYQNPVKYTRWNNVKALGRLVPVVIELGVAVDQTGEPSVITATIDPDVVVDKHRVRIFEADNYGTDREITLDPSSVSIVGTTLTIEIPRCRTVKYELQDTPPSGLNYDTLTNFIDTVDIYYFTTVNEDSFVLTKGNCTCETREQTSCLQFATVGLTTVRAVDRCSFPPCLCDGQDIYAGFYYEAGEPVPNQQVIDMIIRLAHVKMPDEPCGCEVAQRLWARDREYPSFLLPDQLKCPFGIANGAFIAYQWARTLSKKRFGYI